jgi:GNAT superfamily N-acetyltransferase
MNPEFLKKNDIFYLKDLQPEGWPDIIPAFEFYVEMPFCNPVKINNNDKIAGIGSGNSFGSTAWLSHIITRPEFRKKGIAGAIVNHLHKSLMNSGCETISLIATDYGYPVYKKAGFIIQSEYVFFARKDQSWNFSPSKNIIRYSENYMDDILHLDKKISGEDRSVLFTAKLPDSYIYLTDGRASGFYLPGLGEGLIIADNSEAGINLLNLKCSGFKSCTLPCENTEAIVFLQDHGYIETKRVKRMISGPEFLWHPENIYSRIGGNFG